MRLYRKHRVAICPDCRKVQVTTSDAPKCLRCGKISGLEGNYVFDFDYPQEATEYAKKVKEVVKKNPWNLIKLYTKFLKRRHGKK